MEEYVMWFFEAQALAHCFGSICVPSHMGHYRIGPYHVGGDELKQLIKNWRKSVPVTTGSQFGLH